MFARFVKARFVLLALLFLAMSASAIEINKDTYTIYYGDLDGDGDQDFYFEQKPWTLILHGDIATPIQIKGENSFAVYNNFGTYSAPVKFSLSDAELASNLANRLLLLAVLNTDYFLLNPANNTLLFRGADAYSPALLIKSYFNVSIPAAGDVTTLSVNSYAGISDRNVRLRIVDINNDGRNDILLAGNSEGSSEYAYLADNNSIPSRHIEVTPAISRPTVVATHVGTTAGQFRVDESGAATYSIPLNMPEGVAGVTPQVALAYSSGGGNGIAGLGWSLSGLSAISRCRQTLSQDDNPQPIKWNSEDRFCLDGQRLILTSGGYGAAGSTYKTEIDSVIEVTAIGGQTAGHPDKFEVKAKDGSITTYGGTSDSKLVGSSAQASTLTWAISRFEDNMKNAIEYAYDGDATSGQRIKNIYYAYSSISTATRGATNANARVEFQYHDSRPDNSFSYVSGFKFSQQKLLKDISVYSADSLGIMNRLRSYNLSYMLPTVVANRFDSSLVSRLVSVQECRNGACYSPLSFEWGGGTHLNFFAPVSVANASKSYIGSPVFADYDGDGKADLAYVFVDANSNVSIKLSYSTLQGSGGTFYMGKDPKKVAIASIDYNVDGRMDLAFKKDGKWFVALSKPQSPKKWSLDLFSTTHVIALPADINSSSSDPAFVDINSDGLSDIVFGDKFQLLKRNKELDSSFKAYSFEASKSFLVNYASIVNSSPLSHGNGTRDCGALSYNSVDIVNNNLGDFNADGRMDFIVRLRGTVSCLSYRINEWVRTNVSFVSIYAMTTSGSDSALTLTPYAHLLGPNVGGIASNFQTTDINGDGLTDLVQQEWVGADLLLHLRVNNGRSFDAPVLLHKLVGYTKDRSPQFIDVNNDGTQDIVTTNHSLNVIFVKYEKNENNQWVYATTAPSLRGNNGENQFLMDLSGDGILDLVSMSESYVSVAYGKMSITGPNVPCEYKYVHDYREVRCVGAVSNPNVVVPANQQHNAIYRIHNGLGGVTEVAYGTFANSEHYSTLDVDLTVTPEIIPGGCSYNQYDEEECYDDSTINHISAEKFYERLNGGWALPEGSNTLIDENNKKDKPVLEVHGSMQIVTAVESSAPIVGNAAARSRVEYKYSEAKIQASGRGFLGFARLTTIDAQTKVETVTTYRQDFPFIGSPISTTVYSDGTANRKVLSHSYNHWNFKKPVANSKAYAPYIEESTEKTFNADSPENEVLQTVTVNNTYDHFGNITDVITITEGKKADGSNTILRQEITNTYGTSDEFKKYGRLTDVVVKTSADGSEPTVRSSTFTYYQGGAHNFLLESETVVRGSETRYQYDVFGNKTQVSVTAKNSLGVDETRNTFNSYSPDGRHLLSTRNDLSQSAKVSARNEYGQVVSAEDANRVSSGQTYYDAMGNEYMKKSPDGSWSRTDSEWCTTATCPAQAVYRTYSRAAGGSEAVEFFDLLGRNVRTSKRHFNGGWSVVDTEYDNLSRIKRQSVPSMAYVPSAITGTVWTTTEYDNLGRPKEIIAPDGAKSELHYSGYTTTSINALGQKKHETKNGLGQLVKVQDEQGGLIEYEYDVYGGLAKATTKADGKSISVRMCYDSLGRKKAMLDPDKGGTRAAANDATIDCKLVLYQRAGWWTYQYNGFGELTEQADPKGQRTQMHYDLLGRMVGRVDYLADNRIEGFTQWFYEKGVNGEATNINGKLTAVVMNTQAGLTQAQITSALNNGTASCSELSSDCHKTLYKFGDFTRPVETETYHPGNRTPFIAKVEYDYFGRIAKQYDALNNVLIENGKPIESGTRTSYNDYGYVQSVIDLSSGQAISTVNDMNARGQVTRETRGNSIISTNVYDALTGQLTNQQAGLGALLSVQNISYQWDKIGNLKYRKNHSPFIGGSGNKARQESFCYDSLNRLVKTVAGQSADLLLGDSLCASPDLVYDGFGNIKNKNGVVYDYSGANAGPHAVTTVGSATYIYDANGNAEAGDGRTFAYTSYDMVSKISKATDYYTEFKYGPERARWQRVDKKMDAVTKEIITTTTTYLGTVERIVSSSKPSEIEWKRNVAGVLFTYKTNTSNQIQSTDKRFVFTDHLGSVDVITDATGVIRHSLSFDAWGARRSGENWTAQTVADALKALTLTGFTQPITTRGYTGHEMVDDMGIIHMNGRIYDAKIARFLQADPFIQAATNTQSYNRYSYVLNNPLNATDPSGFFFKKIYNGLKDFRRSIIRGASKIFGADVVNFVGNAMSAFCGPAAAICSAAWNYDFARAMGATSRQAFGSAVIAAISSGFSQGLQASGLNFGQAVFASAVFGGVMAELQGGKFGHGFASAGLNTVFGGAGMDKFSASGMLGNAIVGGTISELTGGKFANGARSAAMNYAMQWGMSEIGTGGTTPENTSKSSGTEKSCNPINIATGEKYLTMLDYKAEGASQMTFERYYSSYAGEKTSLGIGWRSNFDRSLKIENVGDITLRVVAVRHQGDPITFNWISDESENDGHWATDDNRYESIRKTDSGWELQLTNNSIEVYNAEGRLIVIKQIDGYEQTLVYGDQGTVKNVLLSVTDNFGQQLQFAYDLQARMTSMTATDGSVTRYEYDAVDNLAKVISPDETPENKWDNSYVVYDYNDKRFSHAITGIRNSQGQRIHSMAYDDSGRAVLSALGDDVERVDMVFSAGENHTKKTVVKNSLGKNTEYTFDQHNKPLVVEGQPTATCIGANQGYEYSDKGQLTSKTDWNGSTTQYEYNDRGLETLRVEAVGTSEERRVVTQWHAQWRLPVQVTSAGLVVEFDYNDAGQLMQRSERDTLAEQTALQKLLQQYPERVWSYSYNAQGLLQFVDGPRTDVQDVTEFEYDSSGNRTAVINALGHRSEVIVVNERGLPEQVRDANGVVTVLAYNARGWLTHKTLKSDKGDSTTVYHYSGVSDYNNQGLISSITLPTGEEITYEYDSARRLVAQHNKAGERLEYTLDLEGNRTEQRIYNATGALTFSQAQVFDELSRLLASIGADGNAIGFGYDKAGNRTTTTDALGHNTSYAYDALNRLIATTDALDGEVTQTYDAANRVTSITDQRGLTTHYRYNGFGNKIAQINPDTGETQYGYDEAGNLTSKTDARGVVTEYRYDVLGRVTDVIYPAANDDNIHYRYDDQKNVHSIGRVSRMSDASGEQVYSYNAFGQVTEVQSQIGVTRYNQSYDYDRNGQLVAQQYPSGRRVNYHYDAQGRLATVDTERNGRSENVLTQLRHQPFGPLATLGYGNGTQLQIEQDNNYRVRTQQLLNAVNDALYHRGYDYDANSNIVGINDYTKPAANQVFVYDALSRLTDATGSYGIVSYGYDAVGNRMSRTQNNRLEDYTYAENSNRLLSVISEGEQGELTTRALGYDAVGNITSDSADLNAKILGFGANNRLEQVSVKTGSNNTIAAYQYNAKGQRVSKQVDGKITHFHYDTENRLLAETTDSGAPIREYIYAANQRIALVDYQQNSQGVVYFMVNDHLGTPQLLLDAQQQVVWSVDQSPFGEVKVDGNIEQPLRFPGQYADAETGYSYNYFRDYDPTLGRYIESDPIGLEAGVNTFGYVMGNPVGVVDLYGLAGLRDIWDGMGSGVSYDNVYQARQAAFISNYSMARINSSYVTGSLIHKQQSPFSLGGYTYTPPSEYVLEGLFRDMDGYNKGPVHFNEAMEIVMSVAYRSGQPDSYYAGWLDTAQDIANNTNLPVGIKLPNEKNHKWFSPNACPVEFNVSYSF